MRYFRSFDKSALVLVLLTTVLKLYSITGFLVKPTTRLFSKSWLWSSLHDDDGTAATRRQVLRSSSTLSPDLVHDLDLVPLMQQVAKYTVTLRGRRALLQLVTPMDEPRSTLRPLTSSSSSSRQRRAQMQSPFLKSTMNLPTGTNASEARHAYEWVEQATLVLQPPAEIEASLELPPFYPPDGPFSSSDSNPTDSDDDEWLDVPILEWSLQDVIKAEKVMERLCQVHVWSQNNSTQTWAPLLANKASEIPLDAYQSALREISGAVEIVRVKTATDPTGRSSFMFRLSETTFPVLRLLRNKETDLRQRAKSNPKVQDQLDALEEELQEKEASITMGLCRAIAEKRADIDAGLNILAELDVWFAKAAFGIVQNGVIPIVQQEGVMQVSGFVHPLIHGDDSTGTTRVVPVDLRLACDPSSDTVASDSLPPPRALSNDQVGPSYPRFNSKIARPVVGFFDAIITAMGDRQSVATGQSTFMAQLSSYATILQTLENSAPAVDGTCGSVLVLLDELGSGTEAEGGGAIGQAILEHMLESTACRVVATTHSSRLKATSFQDDRFACATVLLEETAGAKKPSYRLEYGLIGESFALEAATRAKPQLPLSVLQRAAELCRPSEDNDSTESSTEKSYLAALTASLEKQKALATMAREQAEIYAQDMATCRAAMIRLAQHYNRQLGYWESRVTDCYTKLRQDAGTNSLELLGETLDEIRVSQKQVSSQIEKLKQRGLRLLPSDYTLTHGELVVIVDGGEWDGVEGSVVLTTTPISTTSRDELLVSVSWSPFMDESQVIRMQRHQVAIWDYDSVFEDWDDRDISPGYSRQESQRRLNSILSTLSSDKKSSQPSTVRLNKPSYTSSRQRKAVNQKRKKK